MTIKQTLVNQTTFRILYFKYKPFLIPVGVIAACLLLFLFFIIPQFQDYLSLQDQKAQLADRVTILSKNFSLISSMDNTLVDKYARIVTQALPADKDFSGILEAISDAAVISNVRLGDYSFVIGDLSAGKQTNLQLNLTINGGVLETAKFITALKNQLPLSDVLEAHISDISSSITLVFFYKPIPNLQFQPSNPLQEFSPSEINLLGVLEKMSLSSLAGASSASSGGLLQ